MPDETTDLPTDGGYLIIIDPGDSQLGTISHGSFASREAAVEYAERNRDKLGLARCVSWHVEHADA